MAKLLDNIHSAIVLLDADSPEFQDLSTTVEAYFRQKGITAQIKATRRKSLFWVSRRVDLFLSLLPLPSFALWCNAQLSNAKFKVGRFQIKHRKVFDLVVSDNSSIPSSQIAVFKQITYLLENIK